MKFPKLYAFASSKKVKVWEIEAKGNFMVVRHGYEDGVMQENSKPIKGVNIGKTNATTDEEQCVLECKAKWQKKKDEQYAEDRNKIKGYAEQEILLPMLAHRFQDHKDKIKFPCFVQPKLNGVRCIYQNGKFMSRKGKEYTTLSHLVPELKHLGITIPDGEIYVHGMNFQEIVRMVKKDRGTASLEYWIYDQVNDRPFFERTTKIASACYKAKDDLIKVKYVFTTLVNSEAEIKRWHDKWTAEGFEGVIVRSYDGLYCVKHRTNALLKYKEFVDEEFEIVGGFEGEGLEKGAVIFVCKTKDGKEFHVRPKGSREIRCEWFKDLKNLIGKELTVRYQNLSEDGIPIFPVGVAVRDYE